MDSNYAPRIFSHALTVRVDELTWKSTDQMRINIGEKMEALLASIQYIVTYLLSIKCARVWNTRQSEKNYQV